MKKNEIKGIYTFRRDKELFLNASILPIVILVIGAVVEIYVKYYQYMYVLLVLTILLIAYIMSYPSYFKHLYYRWLVFRYNRNTIFSIDTEQKLFTYKHGEDEITFVSEDIEKWSYGDYRTWNTTFVGIVRIKLKDGKKIEISSGIGDVDKFLWENEERLGLPKRIYRYGDNFKSLQAYIKRIEE